MTAAKTSSTTKVFIQGEKSWAILGFNQMRIPTIDLKNPVSPDNAQVDEFSFLYSFEVTKFK